MLECRVGQAGQAGQARSGGIGNAVDGDQVQVGDHRVEPVVGDAINAAFGFAAQMLEDGDTTRAETAFTQQPADFTRASAIVAQYQQANTASPVRVKRGDRAGDDRKRDHVLQGPAHPRGGQRAGRGGRQDQHLIDRQLSGEAGADAKEHRIATGEDADRLAASGQYRVEGKRAGPWLPFTPDASRQQIQLPLTANDPRSAQ
ncbi:hypothetical protein D3C76_317420 [compost metagenome]